MQKTIFYFIIFFVVGFTCAGQSKAIYTITFNSIWNATDHSTVPSNAHWSKLVGATHKTPNTFLEIGQLASVGIKNIAETGNNTVFNNEVTSEISNNEADQYIDGPSLSSGSGNIVINNLEVNENFPFLTLVSMIAPSPDWFVSINSINLLDMSGNWKTSLVLDVFGYDAGTDSGTNYSSNDLISNPFEPISRINIAPINGNRMGTITISLESVLNVASINSLNNITIYPNPSRGNITIKNPTNELIERIIIYNVLGKKVTELKDNTIQNYDVSYLNEGIYILKIISKKNGTKTQKLVIE